MSAFYVDLAEDDDNWSRPAADEHDGLTHRFAEEHSRSSDHLH